MFGPRTQLILRYAFALAAVVLIGLLIDPSTVAAALRRAEPGWLVLGMIMGYALLLLNTAKWRLLISSQIPRPPSIGTLFRLNLVSALYGTLLPGQIAGEAVKVARLARRPAERRTLVASVLADRVTGFIGLLVVGVVGASLGRAPVVVEIMLVGALGAAVIVGIGVTYFPAPQPRTTARRGWGALVRTRIRSVVAATAGYRQARTSTLFAIVLSTCFQAGVTLSIAVFARSISIDLSIVDIAWITAIVSVVQLLPITVASVGTREGTFIVLLASLSVSRADALALSLLVLASNLVLALGGAFSELLPASAGDRATGTAEDL